MGDDHKISRFSDKNDLRWYYNGDQHILSVTTVLKWLDENTDGLEYWKDDYDGSGDKPYWEHIFWYSGPRGTLCHHAALSEFEDSSYHGDELWGEEEAAAWSSLSSGPTDEEISELDDDADAPPDEAEVVYSLYKDKNIVSSRDEFDALFADTTLLDVARSEIDWFTDTFESVCDDLCVTEDDVCYIEKYVHNSDKRIAGQADLIYEDVDGNYVVADLKTSSSLRQKHRLQSVAYKTAVENADWGPSEIDRVEVWRFSPANKEYQVHSSRVPSHATDYDWFTDDNWLVDPYGDFEYDSVADMWDTFAQLADDAHNGVTEPDA